MEAGTQTSVASPRRESGRRLWESVRRSVALPVLAAALAFLVIGYSAGSAVGDAGDPSYLIKAGRTFVAPELLPAGTFVEDGNGYDGQFFFYIAQDPLLGGKAAERDQVASPHIDNVAYRYQRILLPASGWLTSWGDPGLLQWTLPLINLLAVLGATFLLARFLAARGRSPWLSLVFALTIGVVVGVVNDLSDPLAASLLVAGIVLWLEHRTAPAVVALAACLLAREVYLLPVAVIFLIELWRQPRRSVPWLLPLAVLGVWQVVLRLMLAGDPSGGAERPSVVPLLGALRKVHSLLHEDVIGAANWEVAFVTVLLAAWAFFCVCAVVMVARRRQAGGRPSREEVLPVVALAAIVLVPFLTLELWTYIPSYARYSAPAAGALVLLYALQPGRVAAGLMIALVALTLTNPVVALWPVDHPAVITPPPAPALASAPREPGAIRCLSTVGLTARLKPEQPRDARALDVALGSDRAATILLYDSVSAARRAQPLVAAFAKRLGGEAIVRESAVVAYPAGVPAAERARLEGCL